MRLIHHVVVDHKFTKNDAWKVVTNLVWVGRLINFKNIRFQILPGMYLKKNFSIEIYDLVIFYHEKRLQRIEKNLPLVLMLLWKELFGQNRWDIFSNLTAFS